MRWTTVLALLLVLGLGLFFLRLSIRVIYIRDASKDCLSVTLKTLWLIRYTLRFPLGHEGKEKDDRHLAKKKKDHDQDRRKGRLPKKIPPVGRLLGIAGSFLQINKWLIRHIHFKQLIWETRVGFEDAALTGMAGGMLWGVKGILFSILQGSLHAENCRTQINVTPVFCRQEIGTKVDCILDLRVGYIIIAGIRLLLLGIISYPVLKGVRLHERPSN